jgi:hypothetical protein
MTENKNKNRIQTVVDSGVVPMILFNINKNNQELLIPCVRILRNISTGTTANIKVLLEKGVLTMLENILINPRQDHEVMKEACNILINIAAIK